jgi:hypothetical protein
VLLTKLYRGAELVAMHCGRDVVSIDGPTAMELLLHLYSRLCIAERRQRNENVRKRATRNGLPDVPDGITDGSDEATPLPEVPTSVAIADDSKEGRLAAALWAVPLLFKCCACHLAAAFNAPQKRFRTLVKALRAGVGVLPDTAAERVGGSTRVAI